MSKKFSLDSSDDFCWFMFFLSRIYSAVRDLRDVGLFGDAACGDGLRRYWLLAPFGLCFSLLCILA